MMKKSSPVWESFEKVDDKQVKCKLCCETLSYCGGTSSMLSHLRSKHPAVTHTQPRQQQQLSLASAGAGPSQAKTTQGRKVQPMMASFVTLQRKCNPGRQETITSLITKMVALDMMPVYMVEGKGFQNLMDFLVPEHKVHSHQTIMRRINKMYGEVKGVVEKGLNDVSDVAITTDAWTSLATESYVTVTVHYTTKGWQMKSVVLDTSELDERHSAENLAIRLELVKADWNLEGKIRVCVRDNAFNQAAAGRLIDDWEDLPCFAHTLQLAVNAGFALEEVNELIKKSGKLVGFFKKSTSASTALESAQERYEVVKHRLIQSCKTRWNSVYEMFPHLDEQKQCVQAVLSDRSVVTAAKEESLSLTAAQWNKIASLLPVLEGLQIAITAMSSEQNVSLSCVLPVVNGLKNNFLKMVQTDGALLKNLKAQYLLISVEDF